MKIAISFSSLLLILAVYAVYDEQETKMLLIPKDSSITINNYVKAEQAKIEQEIAEHNKGSRKRRLQKVGLLLGAAAGFTGFGLSMFFDNFNTALAVGLPLLIAGSGSLGVCMIKEESNGNIEKDFARRKSDLEQGLHVCKQALQK